MRDLLKQRLEKTNQKLAELKSARKERDKVRRMQFKQSRTDEARKTQLVGKTILNLVSSGSWDETDFLKMMDQALSKSSDRILFNLD